MADTETPKSTSERTSRRKVAQLEPVRYDIRVFYLGPNWVKRDESTPAENEDSLLTSSSAKYRCEFDITEGNRSFDAKTLIPSIVSSDDNLSDVAKFTASSGKAAPPADKPDKEYKIKILDWHGTRTGGDPASSSGSVEDSLLGDGGATKSNPDYYKERGWLPDVVPCVPFRVEVRKFVGSRQVDFTDDKKEGDKKPDLIVEVKDPKEEADSYASARARPKEFLKEFFEKYNHKKAADFEGGDNAPEMFGGIRSDTDADENPKSANVLRTMEYKDEPTLQESLDGKGSPVVPKDHLSAATAHNTRQAKFTLEPQEIEQGKPKVGVADLSLVPSPIGGDNYRMLFSLEMDGGDIRDAELHGAKVVMTVGGRYELPKPYAYTTGRFVIWRKTPWELAFVFNTFTGDEIDWGLISDIYERSFIEVGEPRRIERISREKWIELLKQVFPADDANLSIDANVDAATYSTRMYPPCVVPRLMTGSNRKKAKEKAKLRELMDHALDYATTKYNLAHPMRNRAEDAQRFHGAEPMKWQNDRFGCFMMVVRPGPADASIPVGTGTLKASALPYGTYAGDRIFWFGRHDKMGATDAARNASLSSTASHEFGHLKSLRHSHTSTDRIKVDGTNYRIVASLSNDRPADHDGKDAYACLMSYTRDLRAELCGMCSLSMRFYDRVKIQKDGLAGNYHEEIVDSHGPATMVRYLHTGGAWQYRSENAKTVSVGDEIYLSVLGPVQAQTGRSGTSSNFRMNLSEWPRDEANKWTIAATGGGAVSASWHAAGTASAKLVIEATSAGTVTIQYRNGKTTSANYVLTINP